MNNEHTDRPVHPEATFRQAGLDELIKDVSRLGPAPNRSREVFASLVNIALVVALIAILQPAPILAAAVAGAIGLFTAIRWIAGTRKWDIP